MIKKAEMAESNVTAASNLEQVFERAAKHLQSLISQLNDKQLLEFYGLYKQATVGPCNIPKPNWYKTQAKLKWEAWKDLGNMSQEEAMNNYICAICLIDPAWEEKSAIESRAWITVSRLPNTEVELNDTEKTFLDWVKEGQEAKVVEYLKTDVALANTFDDDGLLPIHWATDRGHVNIMKLLIEAGTSVDSRDVDGQTPLHYAASCSHLEAVEYLLSVGAQFIEDNNGMKPIDVADEQLAVILG